MLIDNLYRVESFSNEKGSVTATITLDPDHEIFEGHFPGKPVLPGVCQMQMIKELLERALDKTLHLSEAGSCKFLQIIDPGSSRFLIVIIDYDVNNNGVHCSAVIKNDHHVFLKLSALFTV